MEKIEKFQYPYSDIQKLVDYSFDVACKEYDVMSIDELIDYLKGGWVIYYECGNASGDIQCLTLVNLNHSE